MIERIAAEYQSDTSSVRLTGRYGIGKGTRGGTRPNARRSTSLMNDVSTQI